MSNSMKMVHLQNIQSFETSTETSSLQSYDKQGIDIQYFQIMACQ